MTDLARLRQVAKVVEVGEGLKVVQVPIEVWEEEIGLPNYTITPQEQHQALKALLDEWEKQPDDTPPGWWDEFRQFLRENQFEIPERDLGFEDE